MAVDTTIPVEAARTPAHETIMRKLEWQAALFGASPRRSELLGLSPAWPRDQVRIRVHRNQSFELIESVMAPYLSYCDLAAEVHYSGYDDSLSGASGGGYDLEIVWLDYDRFPAATPADELAEWLAGRLAALRRDTDAPILVANWASATPQALEFNACLDVRTAALAGTRVWDCQRIAAELGEAYWDDRASRFTGTRVSDHASLALARELGCRWVPHLLRPRLKAIVLDLDGTLYDGVLGEDGPAGVRLTAGHRALQEELKRWERQGILLGVASRNERADAQALFSERSDFPLRWADFAATSISWADKAEGVMAVANELRIAADAIILIDDNPGEILSVATRLPVRFLHAPGDGAVTARAVSWFPGLWSSGRTAEDLLRGSDLAAGRERAALGSGVDQHEYLRSLNVQMCLTLRPLDDLARLHELSIKTNQFNLALRRLSEAEIRRRLLSDEHRVVAIRLADRLSDSGLIGSVLATCSGSELIVEELCLSCRALGRGLEDLMIEKAVGLMLDGRDLPVRFQFRRGPRNAPALDWLGRLVGGAIAAELGVADAPQAFGRMVDAHLPVAITQVSL